MPLRPRALAALIALALPPLAQASPTPAQLDRVQVRAERPLPQPRAVRADDPAAGDDVASLFAPLPGLALQGAGGVSRLPVARGLADDRVKIAVDGMELLATCPNHMNPPLSSLAPAQVAGARVFLGLSPLSLGGDSLGSALVVDSLVPHFGEPGADWTTQGLLGLQGRQQGRAFGLDLALDGGDGEHALAYRLSHAEAGNYRAARPFKSSPLTGRAGHRLPLDEVGSSAYETRNQQLAFALRRDGQQLSLGLGRQDMPFQGFPNQRMDLTGNRADRVNLHWQGGLGAFALEGRLWHEAVRHAMDFGPDKRFWYGTAANVPGLMGEGQPCAPLSYTCAAGMPMQTRARSSGARLQLEGRADAPRRLRAGVDALVHRLDDFWPASGAGMWPGTFVNLRDGRRDRLGLFLEGEGEAPGGWQLHAGLRLDRVFTDAGPVQGYDTDPAPPGSWASTAADAAAFNARERRRTDLHASALLAAQRRLGEGWRLELGLSRRSRSPNLHERYAWSTWSMAALMNNTVGDGNGYVGSPDLRPEVALGGSASLDWSDPAGRHGFRASAHFTRIHDYIDAVRLTQNPGGFNVLRHANQSAELAGMELAGTRSLAEGRAGHWALEGSLALLRGRNRETGDGLYNVMPPQARLALVHHRGPWELRLEGEAVRRKTRRSQVRNEPVTPGYALLGLSAGYRTARWDLSLGVDNLLDRFYRHPLGGAYLGQGAAMMLGGVPYGITVPGPGRSLRVGARWRF